MKTCITITVLLAITCFCYSRNIAWSSREKPKISLTDAQARALEALKSRHVDYYCIGASLAQTFSDCDWELHFGATNHPEVWVSVGTDNVRVSDQGFNY